MNFFDMPRGYQTRAMPQQYRRAPNYYGYDDDDYNQYAAQQERARLQRQQEEEYIRRQQAAQEMERRRRAAQMQAKQQRMEEQRRQLALQKQREIEAAKEQERKWLEYANDPEVQAEMATRIQSQWRGVIERRHRVIQRLTALKKEEDRIAALTSNDEKFVKELATTMQTTIEDENFGMDDQELRKTFKNLLSFEETLTRELLSLDGISSGSSAFVRSVRKDLVNKINNHLSEIDTLKKVLKPRYTQIENALREAASERAKAEEARLAEEARIAEARLAEARLAEQARIAEEAAEEARLREASLAEEPETTEAQDIPANPEIEMEDFHFVEKSEPAIEEAANEEPMEEAAEEENPTELRRQIAELKQALAERDQAIQMLRDQLSDKHSL